MEQRKTKWIQTWSFKKISTKTTFKKKKKKKKLCPHGKMLGFVGKKTMGIENGPQTP